MTLTENNLVHTEPTLFSGCSISPGTPLLSLLFLAWVQNHSFPTELGTPWGLDHCSRPDDPRQCLTHRGHQEMLVERLKAFQVLFHPTCFCFSLQERPPGLGRPGCANLSSVKGLKTHLAGAVVGNQGLMRVTVYKKALCRQPDAVKVNKWTRSISVKTPFLHLFGARQLFEASTVSRTQLSLGCCPRQ